MNRKEPAAVKISCKKETTPLSELALMTVEITTTDIENKGIALGGPKEQARAMCRALAQQLDVCPPPTGRVLNLRMTSAELAPILDWIKQQFPGIGGCPLDDKRVPLMAAPASKGAPVSPWRRFDLHVEDGIVVTDDLLAIVAALLDVLHQQVTVWGLDPREPIGALAQDYKSDPACHRGARRPDRVRRPTAARHRIARADAIALRRAAPPLTRNPRWGVISTNFFWSGRIKRTSSPPQVFGRQKESSQ
jgi:hypothetical protein